MGALTKRQMTAVDADMIKFGIDVPRMMELAGLFTALTAAKIVKNRKSKKILMLAGTGNNGGDALVAARHLLNWGYKTDIVLASARLNPVPFHQWKILKHMEVKEKKIVKFTRNNYSLIIDGLLGYNIDGNPRNKFAKLILAANKSKIPILSIDLPSGLDATTGHPHNPCIKATATIALSAIKKGLLKRSAKKHVGKLYVSYMSVPASVNKKFGLKQFSEKKLIL